MTFLHKVIKVLIQEKINFEKFQEIERSHWSLEEWIIEAMLFLERNGAEELGFGMGRKVYGLNGNVIKLATSQFGREQNQEEEFISDMHGNTGIVLQYVNVADDGRWIVFPRVKTPITWQQFKNWLGVHPSFVEAALDGEKKFIDEIMENKNAQALYELVKDTDLVYNDITKLDSWGEFHGELVLIDYGLSKTVAKGMKKTLYT